MSSGNFVTRIYESDLGSKHYIRAQEESAVFSMDGTPNTIPAGPVTSPFWAKTSKGRYEYGMAPRKITGQWNPGQAPADYDDCSYFTVVVYSKSVYDAAQIEAPCTYLGGVGKIKRKNKENIFPET